MKRMSTVCLFAVALTCLCACQREADPNAVQLTGRLFVFNYRLAYATYMVTLQKVSPLPEGSVVVAEFENPAGGAPLTLTQKTFAKIDKIVLESPEILCVRKDRPYAVKIVVQGPDGAALQRLETTVTSNLDQTVLPSRPLVVGPVYTKNPEAFPDGKTLDLPAAAACPAR